MKRFVSLALLCCLGWSAIPSAAYGIGYGGIGGEPAYPDPDIPRTSSIFLHVLNSGSAVSDAVRVVNNTEEVKRLRVYSVDSEVASGGNFSCKQFSAPKTAVGNWIAMSATEVVLEPHSNKEVPFRISVPGGMAPGGYDGCIVVEEADGRATKTGGIQIRFRTGLRVSVTVPGTIISKLRDAGFKVRSQKSPGQRRGQIFLQSRQKNEGNVPVNANLIVETASLFGTGKKQMETRFTVPKGEITDWNFEIEPPFWGGIYKAKRYISYNELTQDIGETKIAGDSSGDLLAASLFGDFSKEAAPFGQKKVIKTGNLYYFVPPSMVALFAESSIFSLLLFICFLFWLSWQRRRWVERSWVPYQVSAQDDIRVVAEKHNVSWKILAKENRLRAPYSLEPGQKLIVPPQNDA